MFIKNRQPAFIVKAKIGLGQFFEEEPGSQDETFITLREPTSQQQIHLTAAVAPKGPENDFRDKDGNKIPDMDAVETKATAFAELLPKIIVDHNFFHEEGKPMFRSEDVADTILERLDVFMFVMQEYMAKVINFQRGTTGPGKSGQ